MSTRSQFNQTRYLTWGSASSSTLYPRVSVINRIGNSSGSVSLLGLFLSQSMCFDHLCDISPWFWCGGWLNWRRHTHSGWVAVADCWLSEKLSRIIQHRLKTPPMIKTQYDAHVPLWVKTPGTLDVWFSLHTFWIHVSSFLFHLKIKPNPSRNGVCISMFLKTCQTHAIEPANQYLLFIQVFVFTFAFVFILLCLLEPA